MKFDRRLLLVGILVLAIGLAVYLRGSPGEDSPEHGIDSDAANGASALRQLAEALGHPTATLQEGFTPDLGTHVLFVLTPTTGFTKGEAQRVADYAAGGGIVVYAAEEGDPRLDLALHVVRVVTVVSGEGRGTGPMLTGVRRVSGGPAVEPLAPGLSQVVILRSSSGQPIGLEERFGRGRVITLTDPLPLCNGYLERADNGRLASDLLSLAGGGGQVAFDEYHHGVRGPSSPLSGWLSTAWGAALAWAVIAVFAGLLVRGRAFGPRLELPGGGDRSSVEHVAAVGRLLRRSRAGGLTGEVLRGAARRALAARYGLTSTPGVPPPFDRGGQEGGGQPAPDPFTQALRLRAPAEAAELEAAERQLAEGADTEQALLAAARRLHRLVYRDPADK